MFTIPDKSEGDSNFQSIFFQEYLNILVAGMSGVDCVLSGLAVTGGADMTPAVAKGSVLSDGVMFAVAASDVTVIAADDFDPRIDIIVVNSSGSLVVRVGSPATNPKPPVLSAHDVAIAAVYVPATDTTIATSQLMDLRVTPSAPIVVYKTTTAETTNTTNAVIEALNKANSGVTIPNGLFLTGKKLRVRLGGNMLITAATTVTFSILYGGTTMFSDVSGSGSGDTDRLAWWVDFDLTAQANNDQALVGLFSWGILGAKTAPATGIGDAWAVAANSAQFAGAAAVDSDAANRLLSVQVTFSVSDAGNELVTETATVELL